MRSLDTHDYAESRYALPRDKWHRVGDTIFVRHAFGCGPALPVEKHRSGWWSTAAKMRSWDMGARLLVVANDGDKWQVVEDSTGERFRLGAFTLRDACATGDGR